MKWIEGIFIVSENSTEYVFPHKENESYFFHKKQMFVFEKKLLHDKESVLHQNDEENFFYLGSFYRKVYHKHDLFPQIIKIFV